MQNEALRGRPLDSEDVQWLNEAQSGTEAVFGIVGAGETLVLRDWTAREFSLAYIRLRPHLERHAARYLRDRSQVEEVVQDAFLYLMTALPELDSEIGVLRFLKWKTKMLALDIIRLNSKWSVTPIEDATIELGLQAQDEASLRLERADDASIVSLALSKLSQRQRQAIVETQLLEKPIEEVAAEMGLSTNAFRQLLYRARAAFKRALVGEAEIQGLPASAVLSIAARKAAKDSGKIIAGTSALLLAIFGLAWPYQSPEVPVAFSERGASLFLNIPHLDPGKESPGASSEVSSSDAKGGAVAEEHAAPEVSTAEQEESQSGFTHGETRQASEYGTQATDRAQEDTAETALASGVEEFLALQTLEETRGFDVDVGKELVVKSGELAATFGLDMDSDNPVQFVYLTVQLPQGEVVAVPTNGLSVVETIETGSLVSYAATDFIVGDLQGALGNAASSSTPLTGYSLLLTFETLEDDTIDVTDFRFEGKTKA